MQNTVVDDPVEESFYFASWQRCIITIPVLLLLVINPIYHFGMIWLLEIDLFMGNFIVWLFFGEAIVFTLGAAAFSLACIPIGILPIVWHLKIWGIAKIPLFVIATLIATALSMVVQGITIWLLDIFATPRTTVWWAQLWGVLHETI